jgi:hypothetical protein
LGRNVPDVWSLVNPSSENLFLKVYSFNVLALASSSEYQLSHRGSPEIQFLRVIG